MKIRTKVDTHRRHVAFQMAEVAIPGSLFADIFRLIAELRAAGHCIDWVTRSGVTRSGVTRSIKRYGRRVSCRQKIRLCSARDRSQHAPKRIGNPQRRFILANRRGHRQSPLH
jgi:hypothetical protein